MTPAAGNTASVTVAPATNQNYQVTYTLAGCIGTASKTVRVYSTVVANAGPDQTYCLPVGSAITIGGSPSASGGSGNYTYAWSPATNLSSTSVANPTISPVVAGTTTYILSVTDNISGCSSVDTMILTIHPQAIVTIASADTDLCSGQSSILIATGVPAGGSYVWSPTIAMTPAAGNTATVTVAPSSNQTYQVTYILNGCSGNAFKTVNVFPTVLAHAGPNQNYCLPITGTVTLGGSPAATSGSGHYSYSWSPATNLSSTTIANPTVTGVATNTEYYLTVTDSVTGCSSIDSMRLVINSHATVTIASPDTDLCTGQCAALTATGLPAGGLYQWQPLVNITPGAGNTAAVSVCPTGNQTYQVIY